MNCPPASAAKIIVTNVSKAFRRGAKAPPIRVLEDVSLELGDNSFVALLGPSGCGKTTLLRLIGGLIQPDTGQITVAGHPPRPGPQVGFVFQSFRLIPWRSVRENVAFGLAVKGASRREQAEITDHYLALVGLTRFGEAYPSEMSGGMKQRVALARALATDPDILLMDEPFASLDAQTRELMQVELTRLWSSRKRLVLLVTHSVDEALVLSDRILLMSPRPGRILQTIDVDLPRPRWDEVRATTSFTALRKNLWESIRDMVVHDPASDFYVG